MSDLRLHISFATIGIAYLMPTELSFSFVFFFFFQFVQQIVLELYGVGGAASSSVWNLWEMGKKEQLGAFAAFAAFLFWSARADLLRMLSGFRIADFRSVTPIAHQPSTINHQPSAIDRRASVPKSEIPAHPDRWMLVGFAGGLLGTCLWSWVAGMSGW